MPGTKRVLTITSHPKTDKRPSKKAKIQYITTIQTPDNIEQGVIFVTGAGDVGQLGLGADILEKARPTLVKLEDSISDICAGGMHTVCLTNEGKVITFGCNDEGALGRTLPDNDAEFEPGIVDLPTKAVKISAGDSHSAALLEDGRVFAWGTFRDSHGNMGMTKNGNEKLPFQILADQEIVMIASGADHLVMLTNNGLIYTCGCAEQGQLGRATERSSGRDNRYGINVFLEPALVHMKAGSRLHFDTIWAGTYCTFARVAGKDDIYVFGLNNYNQLGLPNQSSLFLPTKSKEFTNMKWKQICSGQHHTIALTQDGEVYALGRKEYGRLGLGKDCEDAVELKLIEGLKDKQCVYVGCGSATSFAVTKDGELYGWGMGTSGQLGTGQEDDCIEPTLISGKLKDYSVLKVGSGGQHTVILAAPKTE